MIGVFEKKDPFEEVAFKTRKFQSFPPMFHPHCELVLVNTGTLHTVIDGVEHTLTAGECSLLFPFLTHSYDGAKDSEILVILFSPDMTSYASTFRSERPRTPFLFFPELYPLMNRAIELFKMKNTESEKVAFGYLNAIIGEILGKTELYPAESPEADVTTRVLRYCSEHFKEDISISSVASALYISTSYVSKLFSGKLKYKFREYINALRIEEAKRLLSNSDLQIVEVMLECGFKNQSSFNRVFAQICGTTPYQYRKDNRNTREVKI